MTRSTDLEVLVRSLTIFEVRRVAARFRVFKKQLLSCLDVGSDDSSDLCSILVDARPDLVGAVLAVAAGRPNDKKIEVLFGSLGDIDTLDLLGAVKTATMLEGLGAFFVRLLPTAIRMKVMAQVQAEELIEKETKAFEEAQSDPDLSPETTS